MYSRLAWDRVGLRVRCREYVYTNSSGERTVSDLIMSPRADVLLIRLLSLAHVRARCCVRCEEDARALSAVNIEVIGTNRSLFTNATICRASLNDYNIVPLEKTRRYDKDAERNV